MSNLFEYMADTALANKFYKRLALLCLSMLVAASIFYALLYTYQSNKWQQTIYVMNKEGQTFSANAGNVKETRHLEAMDHTKQFVKNFFEVDRFTLDRNIAIAYDMGGSCIHALYGKLDKESWFSKIKQYNVRQSVLIDQTECVSLNEPYKVRILFQVQIISEAAPDPSYYQIEMIFTMSNISTSSNVRPENNIHNLMIENIDILTFKQLNNN